MKHLFGQNKVRLYRNGDSDLYASSMSVAPPVRELDITLERNSPVPLYYQLAQAIEHAINTGALAPGDRLENELSLTSRLGLSRPTARGGGGGGG